MNLYSTGIRVSRPAAKTGSRPAVPLAEAIPKRSLTYWTQDEKQQTAVRMLKCAQSVIKAESIINLLSYAVLMHCHMTAKSSESRKGRMADA